MGQTAATMPLDPMTTADEPALQEWYAALRAHVATDPRLAALSPMLAEREAWGQQPNAACKLHASVCRGAALDFSGRLETAMIAAIDSYLRRRLFLSGIVLRDMAVAATARALADAMDRRSHSVLPAIPQAQVAAMRTWFESAPALPGDQVDIGSPVPIAEARRLSNFARYPTATAMDCPHLLEIATDPLVLAVVEQHLGTLPTIVALAAWWSFADKAVAEKTQRFHWDGAFDLRYCKLLIYLTDVDANGGPHQIFEGTHGPTALARRWHGQPGAGDDFLQWYMRPDWKTDEAATSRIGERPAVVTGAAGTRFLANTRALHKALLPARHDRLMCQAIYGVSPSRQVADVGCRPLAAVRGGSLPSALLDRPFGYINRLFLERG